MRHLKGWAALAVAAAVAGTPAVIHAQTTDQRAMQVSVDSNGAVTVTGVARVSSLVWQLTTPGYVFPDGAVTFTGGGSFDCTVFGGSRTQYRCTSTGTPDTASRLRYTIKAESNDGSKAPVSPSIVIQND